MILSVIFCCDTMDSLPHTRNTESHYLINKM